MATAKLDQSRILVTKFRQNWLTLKGRSVGQRQTDRQTDSQTNSAENKVLQSGIHIGVLNTHTLCLYDSSTHLADHT